MINGHTFYHFAIGRGFHLLCNRLNEQALRLGESREVTREQHAKGNASARGVPLSHVTSRLASLAIREELARRLLSSVSIS